MYAKDGKKHLGRYDNSSDFIDDLKALSAAEMSGGRAPMRLADRSYAKRDDEGHIAWLGLEGFAKPRESSLDAMTRAMSEGFEKGAKLIDSISNSLSAPQPQSIKRRIIKSDQGDEVDMQAVWAGNLDTAWRKPWKVQGQRVQRVRILVDALASGYKSAEQMAIPGAAAVKLSDLLSASGYAVQVSSGWQGSRGGSTQHLLRVTTKEFNQPVDLNSLAATTVCPGFFRCLGHLWGECIDGYTNGYCVGALTDESAELLLGHDSAAMTFIARQSIQTNEEASEWVDECLAAIEDSRAPQF